MRWLILLCLVVAGCVEEERLTFVKEEPAVVAQPVTVAPPIQGDITPIPPEPLLGEELPIPVEREPFDPVAKQREYEQDYRAFRRAQDNVEADLFWERVRRGKERFERAYGPYNPNIKRETQATEKALRAHGH